MTMEEKDFYVTLDIEHMFNEIIKDNPNLTPEQRVHIWDIIEQAVEKMIEESERVSCLTV